MSLFNFSRFKTTEAGTLKTIDAATLKQWLDQRTAMVFDVREPNEYASGHIPGATLVPLSAFDPNKIPQSHPQKAVLYCRAGQRSSMAAQRLLDAGFSEVTHLDGGIGSWTKAGYPIEVTR